MTGLSRHEQAHTPRVATVMQCMQAPQREGSQGMRKDTNLGRCISGEVVSAQGLAVLRKVQRGLGAHKVGLLPRAM